MAGITLAQAETKLAAWLTAEDDIATRGQSAAIKGRQLTRADLKNVADRVEYWDKKVKQLSRGGINWKRAVPLDDQ